MQVLDKIATAITIARTLQKPVLLLAFFAPDEVDNPIQELLKAVPYLHMVEHAQVLAEGAALIICDSMSEMNLLFDQTVGDDGPTALNVYDGPARVYALTIDHTGQIINENT